MTATPTRSRTQRVPATPPASARRDGTSPRSKPTSYPRRLAHKHVPRPRTSSSVVSTLPHRQPQHVRPSSTQCEMNISPLALTRSSSAAFARRRRPRGGSTRRENVRGAQTSHPGSQAPTRSNNEASRPRCGRAPAGRSPETPQHRPQLQRPAPPPERRPVFAQRQRVLGVGRAQVLGDEAERARGVVTAARTTAASSRSASASTCGR